MLAEEVDIVRFVYILRVSNFIAKMTLNKHQRALVTSFKKYQLNDLGLAKKDEKADLRRSISIKAIDIFSNEYLTKD